MLQVTSDQVTEKGSPNYSTDQLFYQSFKLLKHIWIANTSAWKMDVLIPRLDAISVFGNSLYTPVPNRQKSEFNRSVLLNLQDALCVFIVLHYILMNKRRKNI